MFYLKQVLEGNDDVSRGDWPRQDLTGVKGGPSCRTPHTRAHTVWGGTASRVPTAPPEPGTGRVRKKRPCL